MFKANQTFNFAFNDNINLIIFVIPINLYYLVSVLQLVTLEPYFIYYLLTIIIINTILNYT